MSETVAVTMRVDKDLKFEAQELFSQLGLDMSTAYNLFLRQAVRTRSIPFEITMDAPRDDFVVVDKKAMEYMMREYTEARSTISQDEGWISEEEMLKKHGVNL